MTKRSAPSDAPAEDPFEDNNEYYMVNRHSEDEQRAERLAFISV